MPGPSRLSIAAKLLIWSGALILVFFATTAYLLQQVRQDARAAEAIVDVNHDLDSAIQRMLERLFTVQDNISRYQLSGGPEPLDAVLRDLERFGEILDETLLRHPNLRGDWAPLLEEFSITLGEDEDALTPDATVAEWTDVLVQSLLENQADMQLTLTRMHEAGETAAEIGLFGLAASLFLGIGGASLLAWQLGRSLGEVRRGIRQLGGGSPPRDVRVLSGDELGELARAFNDMAARLRREEAMRSDFIAMLSHEIRTPLTSIRESVDLVGTGAFGAVNERQTRFLNIAEKESVRLSELLTRLMSVTRMESQALELTLEETDVAKLVQSAVERTAPTALAEEIEVRVEVVGTPVCRCDSDHVQQALLNLLGNGVKFSPAGSVVTVSARAQDGFVRICVADQGPGVPEEERERVFLKYYRAPAMRESVDGAGLGLAIAKRIVEAHDGRMWLDSPQHGGSRFCFSLPRNGPKDDA